MVPATEWPSIMSLPAFVINLDRSTDRWKLIRENLDEIGLKATRIVAIDGLCLPDDPSTRLLGAGTVACALSHYKAMAAFLKCAAPAALILEDDADVGPSVPSIIQSLDWWPRGHGLVQLISEKLAGNRIWLGHSIGLTPDGRTVHPIVYKRMYGHGYLIDRDTAEQVLAIAPDVPMPIDHLLFHVVNSQLARRARPLQVVPGVVRARPFEQVGSDIQTSGWVKSPRSVWKPGHFVRLNHLLLRVWALVTGRVQRVHVPFKG
ncbi:MAG: glycosyltransferase family 25 protein [Rhodospirillaceae bacterium]|nr:glycosyltransferase family 25 protein [Rhodospirillaceae bacterium]